jgi:hypothetical protein
MVFGTPLQSPAGRADADAQLLGDGLRRGAGGSEGGYLAGVDCDWRIAGTIGVFRTDLERTRLWAYKLS